MPRAPPEGPLYDQARQHHKHTFVITRHGCICTGDFSIVPCDKVKVFLSFALTS